LIPGPEVLIEGSPPEKRLTLEAILEESFEGWYLRHAKRTLGEIEVVRTAIISGEPAGLAMLKRLDARTGYVFYIAVAKAHRKRGIGGKLLDDALAYFLNAGIEEAYSSVESENEPSLRLFESRRFVKTNFGEVSRKYGRLGALMMYKEMLVVPGEVLLHKPLI
jgi:ribosomal protein S18 acetylase RimI-like enzyme